MRTSGARLGARTLAAGTATVLSLALLAGCSTSQASGTPAASTPTAPASSSALPAPTAGDATASTEPVAGDQPTNGPNVILSPASGATVTGPKVTVSGTGTGMEGNLLWEVIPVGGKEPILQGFTTAGANGTVGPFTITDTFPAGTMTLSLWEPDESDGTATKARHNLVTVTFTVK
jgi:hypothetical protein